MTRLPRRKTSTALAVLALCANGTANAAPAEPALTLATSNGTGGARYARAVGAQTSLTPAQKLTLLRQKVKYVFVLFQENRSFDSYFGTYPGANGLFTTYPGADPTDPAAQSASQTPSFTQHIRITSGAYTTITPFLSPRTITDVHGAKIQLYPESISSVDHSHAGLVADLHPDAATLSRAKNDGYALAQEHLQYRTDNSSTDNGNVVQSGATVPPANVPPTRNPTLQQVQQGEIAMSHRDCDTVPFLWHYADIGTLFDNLHQTMIGPSSPNAIAMISAQSGATQWALHPSTTGTNTLPEAVPNLADYGPFAGSAPDTFPGKPPYGADEEKFAQCATPGEKPGTYNNLACREPSPQDPAHANWTNHAVVKLVGALIAPNAPQMNLTYASLPLSLMGSQAPSITAQDAHAAVDLADIQNDLRAIAAHNKTIPWRWYQQGFGPEPFDSDRAVGGTPAGTPHASYIVHHNGPQYFGYLGDNPAELANMHSLQQFYTDITAGALPPDGGVIFVRGGFYNNDNLQTADPSPAARVEFAGNDDHPSYADSQISESLIADSINAIAASKYWPQSAIVITYDETDGFYDHAPESIRNWGPDGLPMSGGPRIPTVVLSPYSAAHTVAHNYAEHGSVIKFINLLFGLIPLSDLPDEKHAQTLGATEFKTPAGVPQIELAPNDGANVSDLFEAFDNDRLQGAAPPLPPSAVTIPRETVLALPHYGGAGCTALNITPTDYPNGYVQGQESDPPPRDFNPRPAVSPGIPYLEQTILGGVITSPWTP
jgi:phospholipase C